MPRVRKSRQSKWHRLLRRGPAFTGVSFAGLLALTWVVYGWSGVVQSPSGDETSAVVPDSGFVGHAVADDHSSDDQSQKPTLTTDDLFSDPLGGQDGSGSGSTVIASTLTSFPTDGNGDPFDGKFSTDFGPGSPFGGSNNGGWGTGGGPFGSGGFGGFGAGGFGGGGPMPSSPGSSGGPGGATGGQSNGQGTSNQSSGSNGDSHSTNGNGTNAGNANGDSNGGNANGGDANGGSSNGGNSNGGDSNAGGTSGGNAQGGNSGSSSGNDGNNHNQPSNGGGSGNGGSGNDGDSGSHPNVSFVPSNDLTGDPNDTTTIPVITNDSPDLLPGLSTGTLNDPPLNGGDDPTPVPEPASLVLLGTGLIVVARRFRRTTVTT